MAKPIKYRDMEIFKHSAFTDNTPEMRRYLESLGYKIHGDYRKHEEFIISFISTDTNEPYYTSTSTVYMDTYINEKDIDCTGNSELFKAITAIRGDSDYMQWFTDNKDWWFCIREDFSIYSFINNKPAKTFHKATKEELIKHFKPYANKAND